MEIIIDIDGVIRDSIREMVSLYNDVTGAISSYDDVRDYDVEKAFPLIKDKFNISPAEFFFVNNSHRINVDSGVIYGADESIVKLRSMGHKVYIVSYQPSSSNQKDTLEWLINNHIEYDGVMFVGVHDKSMVRCDLQIDDHPKYFNGVRGEKILVDAPYNKYYHCEELNDEYRFPSLKDFVDYLR